MIGLLWMRSIHTIQAMNMTLLTTRKELKMMQVYSPEVRPLFSETGCAADDEDDVCALKPEPCGGRFKNKMNRNQQNFSI